MIFSKRKLLFLLFLLVVIVLGIYFAFGNGGNVKMMPLGLENDGESVVVDRGNVVLIKISENPSTGYRWQFDLDDNFAELMDNEYVSPENQVPGKGGVRKIKLKIISNGKFSMQYVCPWENKIENKFSITFTVED